MTVVFMGREGLYAPAILSKQRTGHGALFFAPGHNSVGCSIPGNPYLTRTHPWNFGVLLCRAKIQIRLSISTSPAAAFSHPTESMGTSPAAAFSHPTESMGTSPAAAFSRPTESMGTSVGSLNFLGQYLGPCSHEVLALRARESWGIGYWRKALPSPLTTQGVMKAPSLGQELSALVKEKLGGRFWRKLGKNPKKDTQDPGIIGAEINTGRPPSWIPRIQGIFTTRTDTSVYCSSVPNLQGILSSWTKTGVPCSTMLGKRYVGLLGPTSILVQIFKGKFPLGWIPSVGNPWYLIILMICFFLDSPHGPCIPLESWCKGSTLREIFSMEEKIPRNLNILGMSYPSMGTFPPKKFKEGLSQPWIHLRTLSKKSGHPINLKKYPTLLVG